MWTATKHIVSILLHCAVVCTDTWNRVFPVRTYYHHKSLCYDNLCYQVIEFLIANNNEKYLMVVNVQ